MQKLVDRLNLVTRENLTGLRVIRAFNNEKLEQAKFEKANVDLTAANLFVNRLMVVMQPVMMLILNLTSVLDCLDGSAFDQLRQFGNWQYDCVYAICDAGNYGVLNDFDRFYYGAARFGFGRASK